MTKPKPERVTSRFPRHHIKNIGAGTIGTIYLQRNAIGEVERAEAKLEDAPFKTMIITSPHLLQIFRDSSDSINFDVLNHPAPEFRLVESEPGNFDVGMLVAVEYVRTNDSVGIVSKERASSSRVSIVASAPITTTAPRSKSRSERSERPTIQPTRTSGRNHGVPLIEMSESNHTNTASPSPQAPPIESYPYVATDRAPPGVDVAAVTAGMDTLRAQVLDHLSEEDQEKYTYLLTRGCKTMSKAGQAARDKMRLKLRELLESCGDEYGTVAELHNEYADLFRKIETRLTHQIPKIETS
jgi:hypothetical protein